jgi:acyl-coenzyme A synthetase/AMP-(fatty) acid ligase
LLEVVKGIVAAVRRNNGAPALITGNRSIGYAELLEMVACVSNHLVDRGLTPGSKLFINVADPDLRLIVMIAAMHCGMIPFAILEIGDLAGQVDYDAVVGAPAQQVPDPPPDVTIDQAVFSGKLSDAALREFPDRPDDAILFVGATTGTTGQRKLVAATRGVFGRWAHAQGEHATAERRPTLLRFGPDDRLMTTLGDVTYGGVGAALQSLTGGATFIRASRDRAECVRHIVLHGVNRLWTTGGTLGELMDSMDAQDIGCPSVKHIVLVGTLFGESLVARAERHFAAEMRVAYGATEVGRISSGLVTAADFRFGYVGEVAPEVTLLSGGTASNPAPLLLVHNPATYTPYYNAGKIVPFTEKTITLPDLGYAEGSGLYLAGRDDEVVNINGNKTAFSLIDAALRNQPGIKDVAVVSASPVGDESGLVIAVVAAGDLDIGRLVDCVRGVVKTGHAADYVRIFKIDAIPRNTFGKTDRGGVIDAYHRQR